MDLLGDETSELAKAYIKEQTAEVNIQAEEEDNASNIESQVTTRKKKKKKKKKVEDLSEVPEQSNVDDSF